MNKTKKKISKLYDVFDFKNVKMYAILILLAFQFQKCFIFITDKRYPIIIVI